MVAVFAIALIYFPIYLLITCPVWMLLGFLGVSIWIAAIVAIIVYIVLFVMLMAG